MSGKPPYAAFYADPHFGHDNIITHVPRPFFSSDHMTDTLVSRYNANVKPDDVVLWLGDAFWFRSRNAKTKPDGTPPQGYVDEKAEAVVRSLHGKKVLVRGNHDRGRTATFFRSIGFEDVIPECILTIAGRTCRVSHYPYAFDHIGSKLDKYRPKRVDGEILLHGHTHVRDRVRKNMIHLGVDAWNYRPVLWAEVEKLVREQKNPAVFRKNPSLSEDSEPLPTPGSWYPDLPF